MDFVFFIILFSICALRHFWIGIIIVALPFVFYILKRTFSRAETIALILMVLAAIFAAAFAVIHGRT